MIAVPAAVETRACLMHMSSGSRMKKECRMKKLNRSMLQMGVLLILVASALAVKVGEPAPGFSSVDSNGKPQKLSDYKGKYVVLEWHNQGCPYTKKHYESGNMQRLQKDWTSKGVIWLTVISSS